MTLKIDQIDSIKKSTRIEDAVVSTKKTKISSEEMLRRLKRLEELPTLPTIALQVNRLLSNPQISAQEMATVIEKDQAIVPKLLKLVNSAFFGLSTKVSNLQHAIMLLGYNTVRNAILTISVIDAFSMQQKLAGFDMLESWRHAIGVAVMSRFLDQKLGAHNRENAFTAGLLHDIGKLIMAICFTDIFVEILQTMKSEGLSYLEAENRHTSMPHTRIGAFLADHWRLPEHLRNVIVYHHHPDQCPDEGHLVSIVHTANALIHYCKEGTESRLKRPICQSSWDLLSTTISSMPNWFPAIEIEIQEACALMLEDHRDE
jgi:putative nucleotidyltransferase with HDIG domain